MKTLISLMYVLIRVNLVVALLCLLFVMASRQQQAQITAQLQKHPYKSETISWEIKAKLANEQQHILTNQEKYEQRIKKLQEQIKVYQARPTQSPEINKFQKLQPSISAPAPQAAPVFSIFAPVKLNPSPYSVSPRQTIKPKSGASSLDSLTALPTDSPSFPSGSPLLKHPNGLNNAFSDKGKVNSSDIDNKVPPEETIALAKLRENNPENPAPSPSEDKGLAKNLHNQKALSTKVSRDRSESIVYANDISIGLAMAQDKGQIKYRTKIYRRVQTAILALRRGASKEEAIRKSGVPENVLEQLIEWGENRPGRLNNSQNNLEDKK